MPGEFPYLRYVQTFNMFQTFYLIRRYGLSKLQVELVVGLMLSPVVCDRMSCFSFFYFAMSILLFTSSSFLLCDYKFDKVQNSADDDSKEKIRGKDKLRAVVCI